MSALVARWVEFDAGHRVQTHDGQCRRPHGHRYRVTATCEGPVPGSGMVVDFGILAALLNDVVHDRYDHRFIADADDFAMADAIRAVDPEALVEVPGPPTAENLAYWAAEALAPLLPDGLTLIRVDVQETLKSTASWTP